MSSPLVPGAGPTAPLRGELRYGLELARLFADPAFLRPARNGSSPPVILVPGFMAGDGSLAVLGGWLRRRGSRVARAGILLNTDCAEREAQRLLAPPVGSPTTAGNLSSCSARAAAASWRAWSLRATARASRRS